MSFDACVLTAMKQREVIFMSATTPTATLSRDQVPENLTWNLSSIFQTDADWEFEFASVSARVLDIARFKGKLKASPEALAEALLARDSVWALIGKLCAYAGLRKDQDTKNDHYQSMFERSRSLSIKFGDITSYFTPEILKIGKVTLNKWTTSNKNLKLYQREIDDLIRQKKHTLPAAVEAVMAKAGNLTNTGKSVYNTLTDSDLEFPTFTDDGGNVHQFTDATYSTYRDHPDRSIRRASFEVMMGTYGKFANTLAATYAASVRADVFDQEMRGYTSCRAQAMFSINVPEGVYDSLIATVHASLPKLNRYLALRRKKLGLPDLHAYDLYCPMVPYVDFKMSFYDACELILKAVAPLGEEYVATLRKGLLELRWADVLPNMGKATGAYAGGSYLTDPFMLLNWQETLNAIFTLIHEAGHAMHSWFTRHYQPYQTGSYTLFVAEVASKCNEALLTAYLLKITTDVNVRKYILNHAMEGIRTTLFRQTLFAEFEMLTHAAAERGEPLTAKLLGEIYLALNQKYYGTEVIVDDILKYEWMRIPHFYRSFYVYQYATGESAANALAKQILEEGQPARDRYLSFLKSGDSKDSLVLLLDAGVDLSTPVPIQQSLVLFDRYMDEFEKLG
jgi:oligoendopeptidase F